MEGGLQGPGWEILPWAPKVSGSWTGRHPVSSSALIDIGPEGLNSPPRGRGRVGGCLDMGRALACSHSTQALTQAPSPVPPGLRGADSFIFAL